MSEAAFDTAFGTRAFGAAGLKPWEDPDGWSVPVAPGHDVDAGELRRALA